MKFFFFLIMPFFALLCFAQAEDVRKCLIEGIPAVRQKSDFCGEACAEMYLRKIGLDISQDDVFNVSGLDPSLGRGCYTGELLNALKNLGFNLGDNGDIFTRIDPARQDDLDKSFKRLLSDLDTGKPSIVCMHYADKPGSPEHFRLVSGYDPEKDEIIYNEPAEEDGAGRRMQRALFLKLWPLKYFSDKWTIVRIALSAEKSKIRMPGKQADARFKSFANAEYMQHVRALREKFPSDNLQYSVEPPFVVVGNLEPSAMKSFCEKTVRWTVSRLMKAYFDKCPSRILTIWLLKDAKSYEDYCRLVTGGDPGTPYGFFSDQNDALIMNIATGGGTLVHEIAHPFMDANFPECPPWLNEGLGSLYEQCAEKDGNMVGLTNWRLAGLQNAIRRDDLPDFETLTGYGRADFYGGKKGDNYAQARYLCYYLQEKGLLFKFYKEFHANCKEDPSGYTTLVRILGAKDMKQFKKDWQAYVMKLIFP